LRYRALGFGITSASTPDAKGTMPMVPGTKRRHAFSFSLLVDRPGRAIMRREAVVILKTSEFDGPRQFSKGPRTYLCTRLRRPVKRSRVPRTLTTIWRPFSQKSVEIRGNFWKSGMLANLDSYEVLRLLRAFFVEAPFAPESLRM
jgi:hypothetical protein